MAERHLASVGISAAMKRHRGLAKSPCVGSGGRPPRAGLRGPPSIRGPHLAHLGNSAACRPPSQLHTPLWACAPQRAARLAHRGPLDPLHLAARASPSPRGPARHRVASPLLLPLVLSPCPLPSSHHSPSPPVVQQHPRQPSPSRCRHLSSTPDPTRLRVSSLPTTHVVVCVVAHHHIFPFAARRRTAPARRGLCRHQLLLAPIWASCDRLSER